MSRTPETGAEGEVVRAERLRRLRRMLEGYQRRRRRGGRPSVPTGVARLDEALPHGGLPTGAITEMLSPFEGAGAMELAFRAARAAAGGSRTVVVVDTRGDFYPPAAWRLGIAQDRLLVIRAPQIDQALWAIDQTLRCSAVAAVVAPIPRIDRASSRRLQLAAESTGAVGLLLRSASDRGHSFAAVQMLVEPVNPVARVVGGTGKLCLPVSDDLKARVNKFTRATRWCGTTCGMGKPSLPVSDDLGTCPGAQAANHDICRAFGLAFSRLCRVTLLKVREGMPVEPLLIGLGDETGSEPLLPVPGHRSTGLVRRRVSA